MFMRRENIAGYADEAKLPKPQPGLFADLSPRRLIGRFAGVDPASRQLPFKTVFPAAALTKQDLVLLGYDNRDATCDPVIFGNDITFAQDIAWYLNSMLYCESTLDQTLE